MDSRFPVKTSLLNEALDLMRSLAITEESPPDFAQPGLGAESREFYVPPTTHFIATIEDLTDMLDYASEDIDEMDNDAGEEQGQDPPLPDIGRPHPHTTCIWWIHPKRMTAKEEGSG